MKKVRTDLILFLIGGVGYGTLEILWRGHTHPSMFAAGGICFSFFAKTANKLKKVSLVARGIIGGAFITTVEFVFGVVFNIILKKNVWDYSNLPLNFCGQICFYFSVLWGFLSIIFIPFADFINKKLKRSV